MKKEKTFLTIFLFSLLILVLDKTGIFDWLKASWARLSAGVREAGYQQLVASADKEEGEKEKLLSCQAEILSLREENLQLRRLLGAGIKPETKLLPARVVGSNRLQLMIALTGQDKVKTNASVVTEKILLGRIEKIEGNMAKVLLLTNSKLKIPVKIWLTRQLAEKGELNLAEGILTSNGGKLMVKEILASEKIAPDYWVASVVETGDIFLIGQIEKVYPSEDKVFQEAEVKWLIEPQKLLTVAVIKDG